MTVPPSDHENFSKTAKAKDDSESDSNSPQSNSQHNSSTQNTAISDISNDVGVDSDRRADLRNLLEPTKLRLVQQILATDWGSLSARELAARNPSLSESTIRDHLREMAQRDRPFVEKLQAKEREQNIPWTFYAATEHSVSLLKQSGFYDSISLLYQAYDAAERPESIQAIEKFEHRPIPDWM